MPVFLVFIQECFTQKKITLDELRKLLIRTYSPETLRQILQKLIQIIEKSIRIGEPTHPDLIPHLAQKISAIDVYYKTTIADLFQSVMGHVDRAQLLKDVACGRMTIHVNKQTYFGYLQQQQTQQPADSTAQIALIGKFYKDSGITSLSLRQFLINYGHQSGIFGFEHPISGAQPPNGLLLRPNTEERQLHSVEQVMYQGRPALQITRIISYNVHNYSESRNYQNLTEDPKYDEGINLPHCLDLSITLKCKVYWDSVKEQFIFVDGEYSEDAQIYEQNGGLFQTSEVHQYLCQFMAIFFEGARQIFIAKVLKPDSYASILAELNHKKSERQFEPPKIQHQLIPIIPMMTTLYSPDFLRVIMENVKTTADAYALLETMFIDIIVSDRPMVNPQRIMVIIMLINIIDGLNIS